MLTRPRNIVAGYTSWRDHGALLVHAVETCRMSAGTNATARSLASMANRDPDMRAVLRLVRTGSQEVWQVLEAIGLPPAPHEESSVRIADMADEDADFSDFADDD